MRRIILAALLAAAAGPALAVDYPALQGSPLVDAAQLLTPDQDRQLEQQITAVNAAQGHQLAVAVVPDLQGQSPEDYSTALFRQWGLGNRQTNDGVLLLIGVAEHNSRIAVGYGLEGVLTDAMSNTINNQYILPAFKRRDYYGGLSAGVQNIGLVINQPGAVQTVSEPSETTRGLGWWWLLPVGLGGLGGGLAGLNAMLARRRHKRAAASAPPRSYDTGKVERKTAASSALGAAYGARPGAPKPYGAGKSESSSADSSDIYAGFTAGVLAEQIARQASQPAPSYTPPPPDPTPSYTAPDPTPSYTPDPPSYTPDPTPAPSYDPGPSFDGGGGSTGGGGDTGSW